MLFTRDVFARIERQNEVDTATFAEAILAAAGVDANALSEETQQKVLAAACREGGPYLRYRGFGKEPGPENDRKLFGYFQPAIMDGQSVWEDYAFCRRWRLAGGEIWCLLDATISHHGPTTFTGNLGELLKLKGYR